MWRLALRLTVLSLLWASAVQAHDKKAVCEGQFQVCPLGDCALDDALCGSCKKGQLVCPLTNTCLDGGTDSYEKCPGLSGTWLDWTLDAGARAKLMSANFTVEERASQLTNFAVALPHHGIPRFQWLADNLHGVRGERGKPQEDVLVYPANGTMFPAGPALGATWNPELLQAIGNTVATESRALYNLESNSGRRGWRPDLNGDVIQTINGAGISIYSPNVNLARDPRWGRIAEVFTEDVLLMNSLSTAFVNGLQGDGDGNPQSLSLATCKHAAVYDVEFSRQHYSAEVGGRAMQEFYLPTLEACSAGAGQAMCSYNAINGVPACAEPRLLEGALRNNSGFDGFVVSDYDAWLDFRTTYGICQTNECAAAVGLHAGMDMEGGGQEVARAIPQAIKDGLVDESLLNRAFERVMKARINLGTLDPPKTVAYNNLGPKDVASEENLDLALTAARQGIILTKNEKKFLPMPMTTAKRLLVVGSAAVSKSIPLGPYAEGDAGSNEYQQKYVVNILEGIQNMVGKAGNVTYVPGCLDTSCQDTSGIEDAVMAAYSATAVVVVLNLDGSIESEGHDRLTMDLPYGQVQLVNRLRDAVSFGVPMIGVLMHGGVVTLPPVWDMLDAVFDVFYPGIYGGQVVGEALFGKINPSGKLPVTVYTDDTQLPQHIQQQDPYPGTEAPNYSMGLTYKYFTGEPFLPFGYGLSYTKYLYSNLIAPPAVIGACDPFNVTVTLSNYGEFSGDEIVQVYIGLPESTVPAPRVQLAAFKRVHVPSGSKVEVTMTVLPHSHYVVDQGPFDTAFNSTRVVEKGMRLIHVGNGQPLAKLSQHLSTSTTVKNTAPLKSCPSSWTLQ
ncbi:glycoside hydrolase [Chloropicon primus]|nr:glycoside hydrolase [Chloropicon primus]